MDSMTDQPPLIGPDCPTSLNRLDVPAARMALAVLISAPRNCALAIAREIAGTSGEDGVVIVHAADTIGFRSALSRAAAGFDRLRAVVIQDVDALNRDQQAALKGTLEHLALAGAAGCRILATTSVPLFDLVSAGVFDARLFYGLNAVHIMSDAVRAHNRPGEITTS